MMLAWCDMDRSMGIPIDMGHVRMVIGDSVTDILGIIVGLKALYVCAV